MGWGEPRTPTNPPATPSTRPCEYCPAWEFLQDPATVEGERQIRMEERMRTQRLVERFVKRIDHLEAELRRERQRRVEPPKSEGGQS